MYIRTAKEALDEISRFRTTIAHFSKREFGSPMAAILSTIIFATLAYIAWIFFDSAILIRRY